MTKREFLKAISFTTLGVTGISSRFRLVEVPSVRGEKKRKNWVWMTTDVKTSNSEWKKKFRIMRSAGIDAIIPEVYDGKKAYFETSHLSQGDRWLENILPLAKEEGLEVHAWMWVMPCNNDEMVKKHPEWYAVNRKGDSAGDKPAYVDYYKFLCPTREEVREFIKLTVAELANIESLDGIHLDYVRYPDVILAEGIQPKYNIVQDREYPQYDYCYCEVCQDAFKKETGIDPVKLEDPSTSREWKQFRYDRITNIVNNDIIPLARKFKKQVTAAVFPNWEMVRQQWHVWDLDAVLPMLYHKFYNKDLSWITEQTAKGISLLNKPRTLCSGLFVHDMGVEMLSKAVASAFAGGANGISLFSAGAMTQAHWDSLRVALKQ